ncbi:MAG: hypothetical protein GF317_16045 [Candidatus Lokiarchaeota archaeon]|nr:hypothetical protein [Candidatus Lokiarchaeota archaeon]
MKIKINEKALLGLINSRGKSFKDTDTSTTQKVWCYKQHCPVQFKICGACNEKCGRYRDILTILQIHDYFGG